MPALNATQLRDLHRFALNKGCIAFSEADQCLIAFDTMGHAAACHYSTDHSPLSPDSFKLLRTDSIAALLYECDPELDIQPLTDDEALDLADMPILYRQKPQTKSEVTALANALALTQLSTKALSPVTMTGNLELVHLCPMTSRYEPEDMLSAMFIHRDFGCTDIMPMSYSNRLSTPTMVMRSIITDGGKFLGRLTTCIPLKPLRVMEFEEATHEYLGLKLGA